MICKTHIQAGKERDTLTDIYNLEGGKNKNVKILIDRQLNRSAGDEMSLWRGQMGEQNIFTSTERERHTQTDTYNLVGGKKRM